MSFGMFSFVTVTTAAAVMRRAKAMYEAEPREIAWDDLRFEQRVPWIEAAKDETL